jgi:hypothetical protein
MSIIYKTRIDTKACALLVRMANEPAGTKFPLTMASDIMGAKASYVPSLLKFAVREKAIGEEITATGKMYTLCPDVEVTISPNGEHLEVWREEVDEPEDKPMRIFVSAKDVPRPFTLAPISVFHLAGGA